MGIFLKVLSPEGLIYESKEVDLVEIPTVTGRITIFPKHAPLISLLEIGILRYKIGDIEKRIAIGCDGFAELSHNEITVIATTAENADDIDLVRAQMANDRIKNLIAEGTKKTDDGVLLDVALKKSLARIAAKEGKSSLW